MTFAIITPALIAGAFAERMKFSAMLWFIGLWAILVYAPVAHWVWGPDGIFSTANTDDKGNFAGKVLVLDFAGGTVVHINAGVAGLMSRPDARQAPRHGPRPQHGADASSAPACCGSAGSGSTRVRRFAPASRPAWR